MGDRWRLIPVLDAPGGVQMAIDRWLFEQQAHGAIPPTLRFYTWSEPTISLGFHQRRYPAAWDALQWGDRPVPLVRRPTGGRAVLHGGDLSYAVVSAQLGSRRDAYCHICRFLIAGWRDLGVALRFGQGRSTGLRDQANCFALATDADLVVETSGHKLIGSAQVWQRQTVLQHGSMALMPDRALHETVFGLVPPAIALPPVTQTDIISALSAAAAAQLGAEWVVEPLSDREWAAIQAWEPTLRLDASISPGSATANP
jgi:lipoate-protein ligase A